MIPGAGIIAAPGGRVALAARIAGARHHKRPRVGSEFAQAFIRAAAVLHAEDVVNLQMARSARRKARLVDAMLHICLLYTSI